MVQVHLGPPRQLGQIRWTEYDSARYGTVLDEQLAAGERLYSAAYIIPPPPLGENRKHSNHLRLVELMMRDQAPGEGGGVPGAV
jgi:hypothetical protein